MTVQELQRCRNLVTALRQCGDGLADAMARATSALTMAEAVLARATAFLDGVEADIRDAARPERP